MGDEPAPGPAHWTSGAGAYLAVGTSPAAIALGADLAASADGRLSLIGLCLAILVSLALMVSLGAIGVRAPTGLGVAFAEAAGRSLDGLGASAVRAVVVFGMVGWIGFGFALGGAAIGRLLGVPAFVASLGIGSLVVLSAMRGRRTSNLVSLAAGALTLLLSALIVASGDGIVARPGINVSSVSLVGPTIISFLGYVSVFAVRSADFTAGFARLRDVVWAGLVLIVPLVALVVVGAMLATGQETSDVVGALNETTPGQLLIGLAIVGPAHASLISGGLSLSGLTGLGHRSAFLLIGSIGVVAGMLRFDLFIGAWLRALGVVALPIGIALVAEVRRRRRGLDLQPSVLTWFPATCIGLALFLFAPDLAPLVGMGVALAAVGFRALIARWRGRHVHG